MKSGCRTKYRVPETSDCLDICLGVDMVAAWKIYYLTMLCPEASEMPRTVFFKDIKWKALCCHVNKTPVAPAKPSSLCEPIYRISGIGGHLGGESDGFPGMQILWQGLLRLYSATEMYTVLRQEEYPHPLQSGP